MSQKHFILTPYISRLSNKFTLSESFKFHLDNPNEAEAVLIGKCLKDCISSPLNKIPSYSDDPDDFEIAVKNYLFYNKIPQESDDPYTQIAKNWVICRFDYKNTSQITFKFQDNLHHINLLCYWEIIGFLLTPFQERGGVSYDLIMRPDQTVFNTKEYAQGIEIIPKILYNFMRWSALVSHGNDYQYKKVGNPDFNFTLFKNHCLNLLPKIEKLIKLGHQELLLHIGEQIINSKQAENPKSKILILVGILELLLTHNPDFNRFNIEDSISKQFLLKLSIIVNKFEGSEKLNELKKKIKLIYKIRSNIAHGNFKQIHEILNNDFKEKIKLNKKSDKKQMLYNDSLLMETVDDLYMYIYNTVHYFLDDPYFIFFLKEN